jgi:hypothetical protein
MIANAFKKFVHYPSPMVLAYILDPLDEEQARGHFYHVCRGTMQKEEIFPPADGEPIMCTVCEVELEMEDFREAHLKGGV